MNGDINSHAPQDKSTLTISIANAASTRLSPFLAGDGSKQTSGHRFSTMHHTISILQSGQLQAFMAKGMEVTPYLHREVDLDASGNLVVTARSSAPRTKVLLVIGKSRPPLSFPGVLYSMQVTVVAVVPISTDGLGLYELRHSLSALPSGLDLTIQGIEQSGKRVTFTNPVRIVVR